jgi:hypothetical protein
MHHSKMSAHEPDSIDITMAPPNDFNLAIRLKHLLRYLAAF